MFSTLTPDYEDKQSFEFKDSNMLKGKKTLIILSQNQRANHFGDALFPIMPCNEIFSYPIPNASK